MLIWSYGLFQCVVFEDNLEDQRWQLYCPDNVKSDNGIPMAQQMSI
jgi:hypothetical protein